LLARAALAVNQDRRRFAPRELADELSQTAGSLRIADELVDAIFLLLKTVEALDLTARPDLFQRARHRQLELVEMLEGLLEIVGGAGLHRFDRALDLAEARDDDDRGLRVPALEGSQHVDAVHVGQAKVEKDQVRAHIVRRLEPLFARAHPVDFDLVPGQHPRTERADVPFVVDDQDIVHSHKIAEPERRSPNFLPPATIAIRGSAERRYPYRRDSGATPKLVRFSG